jgi:GT2 family glycosyltransferase
MKLAVIVCTYMRPQDIINLLDSIKIQTKYPNQIIIVDGSTNKETTQSISNYSTQNLDYFFVDKTYRGAAKQRNYGIDKLENDIDIVCFLDDDVVLLPNYFEEIIKTYTLNPEALGVGGYILDDLKWEKIDSNYKIKLSDYVFDDWKTKESSRNIFRKVLGLGSQNIPPGIMPEFSHGRGQFPPSNKTYEIDQLIGCSASYRKHIIKEQKFDDFFEGYSLYEDTALSLKVSKKGKLFINTNAKLYHYHASGGRPNQYDYGKMVVRNGWYVWRVKYPNPSFKAQVKWHLITFLLMFLRFLNTFTTSKKKAAFTESMGRFVAYIKLFFNKPKIEL